MPSSPSMIVPIMGKDSRWLQVEVCREFQRGKCSRTEEECRFAHPPAHVVIHNGRVTACFDSLKGRCQREKCKYLHPPKHLKAQLEHNGRMLQQQQQMALQPQMLAPLTQQMMTNPSLLPTWQSLTVPTSNGTLIHQPVAFLADPGLAGGPRRLDKSDKLEVCREYQRGACSRDESECRYAHPPRHLNMDTSDGMVTVCMDFIKGKCQRESCKYFHPPSHLQGKVKAAQQQQQQMSLQSGMEGSRKRAYEAISELSVGEPLRKQAMEVPIIVPGGISPGFPHQGLTTMQFTGLPTVPIMGYPLGLPQQTQQWQQVPSANYMPVEMATPPPTPQNMSPPQPQTFHQPQVPSPPQPMYEPYQYQMLTPQGQCNDMQYCNGYNGYNGYYYTLAPGPPVDPGAYTN
ncbi:muscleblind-like protein 2 isoform X2 [Actinia tenebrosa]|uniref:Muscleblind-like protein 2 isoform X2 n=1 Tax=Actinia tenebrosa TaxID=6105 RepID=A0A6P8HQ39_ACTTE|nr:muscleblind-like protein 2 isoform X2 [Actinia tenebrosa]